MAGPTPDLEQRVRELSRTLLVYRIVALALVLLLAWTAWAVATRSPDPSPFGEAGETWTVDLPERLRLAEAEHGDNADFSETYFFSEDATVHMHFMGHLQTTPLHLHPASTEAVIVAGGTAEVTHAWGEDGTLLTKRGTYPVNSLVASPPLTGHEWHNPSDSGMLANLVFTAPKFSGNFYVHPDDPRLLQAPAPTALAPADHLPAFVATGQPFALTRLSILDGRMHELLVASAWSAPANLGKPVIAYVFAGSGTVEGHPVREGTLVHLESSAPTAVVADAGAPLALALFDPFGLLSSPSTASR